METKLPYFDGDYCVKKNVLGNTPCPVLLWRGNTLASYKGWEDDRALEAAKRVIAEHKEAIGHDAIQ